MKLLKTWSVRCASLLALCVFVAAQESPAPQTQNPNSNQGASGEASSSQTAEHSAGLKIAPGSVIPVQLDGTLDAKKAKPGDEVSAKVTQDLKTQSGQILMPKDTKVVGHITDAQPRSKAQTESQLGIAFDKAVMKDGTVASLPLSIQAVIASPGQHSSNDNSTSGGMGGMGPGPGNPRAGGGRPDMGPSASQPSPEYPAGGEGASASNHGGEAREPVTANTEGVVGMPKYSLSSAGDASKGSVVSSEKETVKLERGTLMLLRVDQ